MKRPTGWELMPIKCAYLEFHDGPHATPPPAESGAIFLGIKNLTDDGHLDLSEIRYISENDLPAWTKRVTPQAGDIVFSYEATLNRYAIIPENFWGCLGRRLALIRPNPDVVDIRFLFYYFFGEEWRNTVKQKTIIGSTVDRIPLIDFPNFMISLPPLETQQRIAAILSAYDDLIENNSQRIKLLEQAAHDLYREWFVHFRFPGHESVRMVESSTEYGEIPEGWQVAPLENLCERITDGSHWSPEAYRGNDSYPMASVKDMTDWGFDLHDVKTISPAHYLQLIRNDCKPLKNDILISKDGANYLKHVFITYEEIELVILSSIAMVRPKKNINPYWLTMTLKEPEVKARLRTYVSGAAIPRIVLKDFRAFPILHAPQAVQDQFGELLSPMVGQIHRLMQRNQLLRETHNVLLPRLVSGEVDVSELPYNGED